MPRCGSTRRARSAKSPACRWRTTARAIRFRRWRASRSSAPRNALRWRGIRWAGASRWKFFAARRIVSWGSRSSIPRTSRCSRAKAGEREKAERAGYVKIAQTQGMRAMARTWLQKMVHPSRLTDAPLIDSIVEMLARKSPEIFAGQIKALLRRPDATPMLAAAHCPTLVLCGRDDAWSVARRASRDGRTDAECAARDHRKLRPHGDDGAPRSRHRRARWVALRRVRLTPSRSFSRIPAGNRKGPNSREYDYRLSPTLRSSRQSPGSRRLSPGAASGKNLDVSLKSPTRTSQRVWSRSSA